MIFKKRPILIKFKNSSLAIKGIITRVDYGDNIIDMIIKDNEIFNKVLETYKSNYDNITGYIAKIEKITEQLHKRPHSIVRMFYGNLVIGVSEVTNRISFSFDLYEIGFL